MVFLLCRIRWLGVFGTKNIGPHNVHYYCSEANTKESNVCTPDCLRSHYSSIEQTLLHHGFVFAEGCSRVTIRAPISDSESLISVFFF